MGHLKKKKKKESEYKRNAVLFCSVSFFVYVHLKYTHISLLDFQKASELCMQKNNRNTRLSNSDCSTTSAVAKRTIQTHINIYSNRY